MTVSTLRLERVKPAHFGHLPESIPQWQIAGTGTNLYRYILSGNTGGSSHHWPGLSGTGQRSFAVSRAHAGLRASRPDANLSLAVGEWRCVEGGGLGGGGGRFRLGRAGLAECRAPCLAAAGDEFPRLRRRRPPAGILWPVLARAQVQEQPEQRQIPSDAHRARPVAIP